MDYLSVNKITKEYYWGDEDNSPGWIGWTNVAEEQIDTAEDDLKKLGYTEIQFPYKIECFVVSITLLIILVIAYRKRKIKKATK